MCRLWRLHRRQWQLPDTFVLRAVPQRLRPLRRGGVLLAGMKASIR